MTNNEIFARIAYDIEQIGSNNITIWMTKDLFNKLLREQFLIHNDYAVTTLFGCRIKVVIASGSDMRWIVGYEGIADEIS